MNWSAYVLGLLDQGTSISDVVILADNPFITVAYVKAVKLLTAKKYLHWRSKVIKKSETMRKIDAYAKEIGTEAFIKEFKEIKSSGLGKKLGVSKMQIKNYYYRHILTPSPFTKIRGKYTTYDKRLIAEGRKEAPTPKLTLEEMKTLW